MIEIKARESEIDKLCKKAIHQAKARNQEQLISITRKISNYDLLHIYEASAMKEQDRVFWVRHDRKASFAAIGCVREIAGGQDRFEEAKREWNKIVEEAWIHDPYRIPGTGLLATGGMAFDPLKSKTALWRNFPDSRFVIPAFLVSEYCGETYLTMNAAVNARTSMSHLKTVWKNFVEFIHNAQKTPKAEPRVREKQEVAPEQWKNTVREAKQVIQERQADKIVLAREMRVTLQEKMESGLMLDRLLNAQKNSYVFAFEHGGDCFAGATPERLVKVEDKEVLSTCLAGTAPRGISAEEDRQIAEALLNDSKNRQEHQFVVHMIEEALRSHTESIHIPGEPVVYPLKNLQHLYTPVTAMLKEQASILDIVKDLHPTPALGGTPREASLQFIRDHELLDRGWYGAPVGWMDAKGNGEFAVAIRSGVLQGDEMSLFAGCGVVADSDPEKEYEETKIKFMPMLSVLEGDE